MSQNYNKIYCRSIFIQSSRNIVLTGCKRYEFICYLQTGTNRSARDRQILEITEAGLSPEGRWLHHSRHCLIVPIINRENQQVILWQSSYILFELLLCREMSSHTVTSRVEMRERDESVNRFGTIGSVLGLWRPHSKHKLYSARRPRQLSTIEIQYAPARHTLFIVILILDLRYLSGGKSSYLIKDARVLRLLLWLRTTLESPPPLSRQKSALNFNCTCLVQCRNIRRTRRPRQLLQFAEVWADWLLWSA